MRRRCHWGCTFGRAVLLTAVLMGLGSAPAVAQLTVSGQADLLAKYGAEADERGLNRNFRSDSPYSVVRARVFAQHWVTERAGVFAEFLFDYSSGPRLNGLYVVLNEIAGQEWLNVRAGQAPSLIGSFGLRSTYYNSNPLIGVPLLWQHRSTLDGSGLATAADLLRRREQNVIGLPLLYDACWNVQWEFLGEVGKFEYSVGVTPGSMTNPIASTTEDGVQALARVGYAPVPELRLGVSAGTGAYLGGPLRDSGTLATSYPGEPEDYDQRAIGIDVEYSRGRAQIFSEAFVGTWEAPLIAEELRSASGYVEGRYDFLPAWGAALRVGAMGFSEIAIPGDPAAATTGWDDDVLRIEGALTHRIAREVQIRAGWQHTRFLTGNEAPINLLAVQLRAVF